MAGSSRPLLSLSVSCFFFSFSSLSRPHSSLSNILTPEAVMSEEVVFSDWLDVDQVSPSASGGDRYTGDSQGSGERASEELVSPLLPGGNAGIAAAYSARKLGIPATILLPETTSMQVVRRLEGEGAEVQLTGKVWDEANIKAKELATRDGWVYVSPFDHPLIWEGNASLVQELKESLGTTSVAKSLGAKTVAARTLECAKECEILSEVVEDREAVSAVQRFLDDERMLVEPACGAALAAVYSGILGRLQAEGRLRLAQASIVVIVCGGNNISNQQLQELKTQLGCS